MSSIRPHPIEGGGEGVVVVCMSEVIVWMGRRCLAVSVSGYLIEQDRCLSPFGMHEVGRSRPKDAPAEAIQSRRQE